MSFRRGCECDECNRRRRRRREIVEVERVGCFGRGILDALREGDKIRVFSGGDHIDGLGVFIRVEGRFLVWVDEHANINVTSLDVISIQRVC